MYYLNKIVGYMMNPITVSLSVMAIGVVLGSRERRRLALGFVGGGVLWLWLCSTPMMYRWVGLRLEREWPVVLAEDAPKADAIVILGGGMGVNTNVCQYAEMWSAADRVWHAARLWKAGKAPIVITSGTGDRESTVPLLRDLGVPEAVIVVEDKARNTEENAKFVEGVLLAGSVGVESGELEEFNSSTHPPRNSSTSRPKVLLVTSAWHMRRSVLMFKKYAPNLEIIPAATDYEALVRTGKGFGWGDLLPSADCLAANSYCVKEYIGYLGYRFFR